MKNLPKWGIALFVVIILSLSFNTNDGDKFSSEKASVGDVSAFKNSADYFFKKKSEDTLAIKQKSKKTGVSIPKTNSFDVEKKFKHVKIKHSLNDIACSLDQELGLDTLAYPDLTVCKGDVMSLAYCLNTETYQDYAEGLYTVQVILNRLTHSVFKSHHYKTISDVIYYPYQFSATPYTKKDGTINKPGRLWHLENDAHGRMMYKIAYMAINNLIPEKYKLYNKDVVAFCVPKYSDKSFVDYMNKRCKVVRVSPSGINYYSFN